MRIYTQSAISALQKCPRNYKLRYIEGWRPLTEPEYFSDGHIFHSARELMGRGKPLDDVFAFVDDAYPDPLYFARRARMKAMLWAVAQKQPIHPQGIELEFCVPLVNPDTGRPAVETYVAGKIDGLIYLDGDWWIVEYKTASHIDSEYICRLEMNLQIHAYRRFAEREFGISIAGVLYDAIEKCSLRPSKGTKKNPEPESEDAFFERCKEWYSADSMHHWRERWRMRAHDVEAAFWSYHKEVLFRNQHGHWPPSTNSCVGMYGKCQFYDYCTSECNPAVLAADFQQKGLHEELKIAKTLERKIRNKKQIGGNSSEQAE